MYYIQATENEAILWRRHELKQHNCKRLFLLVLLLLL